MKSTNFYMKFLIVMLLNITFQMEINSQNYHPLIRSNTYWDVMIGHEWLPCMFFSGERCFFEGDTILDGLHYNIVRANPILSFGAGGFCPPYEVDGDSSYITAFMREDTIAKKVFIYEEWCGDALLYDFSLDVNDTLLTVFSSPLVVDSIRYVNLLNGEERKIFYFSGCNWMDLYYIEGIGGSTGLCYPLSIMIDYYIVAGCVVENNNPLLNLGQKWGIDCYPYVGINELSKKHGVIVYPNPVSGQELTIEFENTQHHSNIELRLYDAFGKEVHRRRIYTGQQDISLDVGHWPSGLYLVVVYSNGGAVGQCKVVVE
jgi:hypothetical protein